MLSDRWGLAVATDDPEVIAGLNAFDVSFITYGTTAAAVWDAAKADPACVMAQAKAACLEMFLQTGQSAAKARPWLVAAQPHAAKATEREQLWLAQAEAWVNGDAERAIACCREIVTHWPEDLAAVKLTQFHMFHVGDLAGMLEIAEAALPAHRSTAEMHGMRAFALEEMNRLAEAEEAARHAIELKRAEPWAHHAIAHVMETQGRCEEGFDFMTGLADTWTDRNSFMLSHNWWHAALFAIDSDRPQDALKLYDDHVWGVWKEYSQDQVNAVALLARLEFAGLDVGDRWQDVADHIERRGPEHVEPFLDAHYLLGLTRAGRDAAASTLLASLRDHVARLPDRLMTRIWRNTGLPLAEGVVAYGRGDWPTAYARLKPALDGLQQIGGSHAQRDLFWQLWLRAGVKAGDVATIRPYFERRAAERPMVAKHRRELAALG
ncbi:tetratricopeptide repeat protein [uncultured Ferrovibrio sp.]|jgi:tetratricopeptide (TPR) repeat protein|uniref:tetratricopeptide repeat protein n=1 Tax=uncultured Ferrovibrio sp. TaxID=1576913 RepID=UPI000A499AEC|nr:tetratricopeptide repeat protein [uncultured Ferrovibrio sp.]